MVLARCLFSPLDVGYILTSLHFLDCAAPPSSSLSVTSVNEVEGGRDVKRLPERHLASSSNSTPSLFYVCVSVFVRVHVCVRVRGRACVCVYAQSRVSVCALVPSNNSLSRLLEDGVWQGWCAFLSLSFNSPLTVALRRALCFCIAHVTVIVPN